MTNGKQTVRYSKKREAILLAIKGTKTHPSAEWLFQTLKPDYPDLSLGTIYRNLSFFQEQGVIKSVGVVHGQERFDADLSDHCHFICNCCSKVMDIQNTTQTTLLTQKVQTDYAVDIQRAEVMLYGTCKDCLEKQVDETLPLGSCESA